MAPKGTAVSEAVEQLQVIRDRHIRMTRGLTLGLSAWVIGTGFVLWASGVPLLDEYKPLTGLVIMVLAAVFYQVPRIAYHLNRRHFSGKDGYAGLMGESWNEYKMRIVN